MYDYTLMWSHSHKIYYVVVSLCIKNEFFGSSFVFILGYPTQDTA